MEGGDALGLIAEVGIAIAGFAGVIATLRAPEGRIEPYAAIRISVLLGFSVEVVILGLLPFAFDFAGLSGPTIWTLSSFAMAVLIGTLQIVTSRVFREVVPAEREDRAPGEWLIIYISTAVLLSIVGLQLANAALFRQLWPFYVGLLGLTGFCLYQFAFILFAPSRSEVPA
jgi:hypothetical protein